MGGSKAGDCVTNPFLPDLQMVCNTAMKNSIYSLTDHRPKAVPGHTFNEKGFPHNQLSQQNDMLYLYYKPLKIKYTKWN